MKHHIQPETESTIHFCITVWGVAFVLGYILVALTGCVGALAASGDTGCRLSLAPELALLYPTIRAAQRWSAATGCEITVDQEAAVGDIHVVSSPQVFRLANGAAAFSDPDGTGHEMSGVTTHEPDRVTVSLRAANAGMTVLHELGHLLGGEHTATGAMNEHTGGLIDDASLSSVCAVANCSTLQPEGM